ncbi:uncharacterized protein KY384_008384 [Bacidia gigantensis]|uniref:uncharacterized protein n=1 Tax=Bacidia gigantensis TaxID=2732470 RepID=UPI001D05058E|nr:uncharacterized protein KY384_008384 [Bacidia gigantensis]KAG8526955.1 hypothetical protein KY384_008384 [Bacidia gigantensis]
MPAEDYSAVSSGALKLKGVNLSSKIHKHKKKRPKPSAPESSTASESQLQAAKNQRQDTEAEREHSHERPSEDQDDVARTVPEEIERLRSGKTEAEIRHEEIRRKRLNDRLKREGTKTHKERVEELNRYLSNLSEHHDMLQLERECF